MPRTVLLTLGRLPKALELARALAGAGCRVLIAEPFARHVCRPSRAVARSFVVTAPNADPKAYLADLLRIIEDQGVDLVVPVSEEALHVARLESMLPAGVRMLSAPSSTVHRLHDKFRFAQDAQRLGLAVPQTLDPRDPGAEQMCAAQDYVVKPRNSCSGIGVGIFRKGRVPAASELPAGAIIQAFVPGRHVSTFTLAHEGREIFTSAYEGTVFAGTVAVCFRRVDGLEPVLHWVREFVSRTSYNGFISFDFIVTEEGRPLAIECNPRITSGIHFAEPADLAAAILQPATAPSVRTRKHERFQQAYSTLTEAYAHFLRPREFAKRMRALFSARDVVWSLRDPMPFLLMTPMSWDILRPAMFNGLTLGEAAMRDIGWFDEREIDGQGPASGQEVAHAASGR